MLNFVNVKLFVLQLMWDEIGGSRGLGLWGTSIKNILSTSFYMLQ